MTDGAIAAGNMERRDKRQILAAIETMAGVERPKPAKAHPGALAAMGIGVRAGATPAAVGGSNA